MADIEKCGLKCDVLKLVAQHLFEPYHIPTRPPPCCAFYNTDGQEHVVGSLISNGFNTRETPTLPEEALENNQLSILFK
jgi:hypothetical protein